MIKIKLKMFNLKQVYKAVIKIDNKVFNYSFIEFLDIVLENRLSIEEKEVICKYFKTTIDCMDFETEREEDKEIRDIKNKRINKEERFGILKRADIVLIDNIIKDLKEKNIEITKYKILFEYTEYLINNFKNKNFDYMLKRKNIKTTRDILNKIDLYCIKFKINIPLK